MSRTKNSPAYEAEFSQRVSQNLIHVDDDDEVDEWTKKQQDIKDDLKQYPENINLGDIYPNPVNDANTFKTT